MSQVKQCVLKDISGPFVLTTYKITIPITFKPWSVEGTDYVGNPLYLAFHQKIKPRNGKPFIFELHTF